MPAERNIQEVERLKALFESSNALISADFTGMEVTAMTELRRALRDRGIEFRVVKNRLTYLAAEAAGRPLIKDIVRGPTGIAFGSGDPIGPAKALTEFVRATRSPLKVMGGLLGERTLSPGEIAEIALLPGREELIARLMGRLQGPITGLAFVLNGPIASLARVLQRRLEGMAGDGQPADEPAPEAPDPGASNEEEEKPAE